MGCARMRWDSAYQRGRSPRRGAAPSRPSQAVMRGTATGYAVAGRAASSSARWETMMMKKAYQAARAASARPRPRPQWRDFRPRSRHGAALAQTHHEGSRSRAYAMRSQAVFLCGLESFVAKSQTCLQTKHRMDLKKTRGSSAHASPVQPCVLAPAGVFDPDDPVRVDNMCRDTPPKLEPIGQRGALQSVRVCVSQLVVFTARVSFVSQAPQMCACRRR